MNVAELIEKLKEMPQDSDVILDMECGCFPSFAKSVLVPGVDDKTRYGAHTGITNGKDVIISSE